MRKQKRLARNKESHVPHLLDPGKAAETSTYLASIVAERHLVEGTRGLIQNMHERKILDDADVRAQHTR